MKATNIYWDVDKEEIDELFDLPSEINIPKEIEDDEDMISEWLSDTYGFCHFGFDIIK